MLGGSPTRLLRLAPAAQDLLADGRLKVSDAVSAELARTLLDATVAHPRPAGGPSHRDVTIVIPVRDNASGCVGWLPRCAACGSSSWTTAHRSRSGIEDFAGAHSDIEILRHAQSRVRPRPAIPASPPARRVIVAFLDSDVVPRRGWLEALLGHFCDPTVALVAPRIVGLAQTDHLVARYEAVRSSLDLGQREAPVIPYTTVSYVPSAAIICRTSALRDIGGFDETMRSGEDVDLCWRLVEAGARLRYEPIAQVAHDHRTELRDWVARKAFYGGSAAPLSVRHPDKIAPLMISGWALTAWILMAFGSSFGYLASLFVAGLTGRRVAKSMQGTETQMWDVVTVAARSLWSAALQLASAICRHYWPVACWRPSCSARAAELSWSLPSWTGWWTGPVAGKPPTTMPSRSGC